MSNSQYSITGLTSSVMIVDAERRKRKLTGDERLNRNRERNRIHARRTRERKRSQTMALQNRIKELYDEGTRLRQLIDETYTASSLLGLAHHNCHQQEDDIGATYIPSSSVCSNYYAEVFSSEACLKESLSSECISPHSKRVRRSGKYSQQERDRIRRERNRMHAKKTRDRKKQFLEMSEKVISEMEAEAVTMRQYLRSLDLISDVEINMSIERDKQSKITIEQMKRESLCSPDEDDEDDDDIASESSNRDDTRGFSNDKETRSQSSGEENDKSSSCGDFTSNGSSSRTTTSSNGLSHGNFPSANLATLEYSGSSDDKQSDSGNTNSSGSEDQDREIQDCNNENEWQVDDYRLGGYSNDRVVGNMHS